jgi:hypothetical protein
VKALATILVVSVLGTGAALAKLTPMDQLQLAYTDYTADSAEVAGDPTGNTSESSYFQAPPEQPAVTEKIFPCRFNVVFAKTRLAQTCN